MDQRADDIQQGIEQTKQEMEGTRAAMTEKLEQLEERVRETVESAASTVEGIVENVKETVDSTVETVKQTVDGAKSSMEDMVGTVKGTVDGTVESVRRTFDLSYQIDRSPWLMFGGSILVGYVLGSASSQPQQLSGWSSILDQFQGETAALKGAIVGALVSAVRDAAQEAIPAAAPYVRKIFNLNGGDSADRASSQHSVVSSQ